MATALRARPSPVSPATLPFHICLTSHKPLTGPNLPVVSRITLPGSLYLGLIALIPLIALVAIGADQNFPFGGTSILIMVGVGLETVKQIDSQLQQRHYEGLLR